MSGRFNLSASPKDAVGLPDLPARYNLAPPHRVATVWLTADRSDRGIVMRT